MDLKKVKEFAEQPEEELKFEWPQAYYLPTDGKVRKAALERALAERLEPKHDEIRSEIWDRRYNSPEGVDRFLGGYLSLNYYANVVKSDFMARFHKKDAKETKGYLCYDIPDQYGKDGEDMLYLEYYHLIDYYIDICLKDKKYSSMIMGIGTMKKENLINKIANDLYKTCYCVPKAFELPPAHKLLQKAAQQCFYNRFPWQKNVLDDKISGKEQ